MKTILQKYSQKTKNKKQKTKKTKKKTGDKNNFKINKEKRVCYERGVMAAT